MSTFIIHLTIKTAFDGYQPEGGETTMHPHEALPLAIHDLRTQGFSAAPPVAEEPASSPGIARERAHFAALHRALAHAGARDKAADASFASLAPEVAR
jgi:hypothetical protein